MVAWHQEITSKKSSKPPNQQIPANPASKVGHFPNCSAAGRWGRGSVGRGQDLESPEEEPLLNERGGVGPPQGWPWGLPGPQQRHRVARGEQEVNSAGAWLGKILTTLCPREHCRPWPWPSSCGPRGECGGQCPPWVSSLFPAGLGGQRPTLLQSLTEVKT